MIPRTGQQTQKLKKINYNNQDVIYASVEMYPLHTYKSHIVLCE